MTREQLQQQYARILLQLETEARTIATCKPASKLARSAKATIRAAGERLNAISTEWRELHQISDRDAIIPELQTYSGFEGKLSGC